MKGFKKTKKLLIFLAIVLSWLSTFAPAQTRPLTQQQMIELVTPAVVFIEYFYKGFVFYKGQQFGSVRDPGQPFFESFFGTVKAGPFEEGNGASGFLVHPDGYILTAGHCVQDYQEEGTMLILYAFLRDYIIPNFVQQTGRMPDEKEIQNLFEKILKEGAQVIELTKEIYVRTGNWSAYKADVLVVSEFRTGKDIGIIKIPGKNFPTLPLGDSDTIKEGHELLAIGYPGIVQDLTSGRALSVVSLFIPTVTKGIVSAVKIDFTGTPVIQTDATTAGGNSGGPAVNANGEAVGVCSWGPGRTAHREGGRYGFFVPLNQARVFISQAGISPQSGLTDQIYKRALDLFWDGKFEKALPEFKRVEEFYPRHPTAQKYILECNERIAKGETGRGFSIPSWLLTAIIVVAALALLFVLFVLLKKTLASRPREKKLGYLIGQEGPLAGNRFPIEKGGLCIGRDASRCKIVLSEDIISREHAVIEPAPDGKTIRVKNLSATNPTYINERPITEAELKEGDRIKVGKAVFVYKRE